MNTESYILDRQQSWYHDEEEESSRRLRAARNPFNDHPDYPLYEIPEELDEDEYIYRDLPSSGSVTSPDVDFDAKWEKWGFPIAQSASLPRRSTDEWSLSSSADSSPASSSPPSQNSGILSKVFGRHKAKKQKTTDDGGAIHKYKVERTAETRSSSSVSSFSAVRQDRKQTIYSNYGKGEPIEDNDEWYW